MAKNKYFDGPQQVVINTYQADVIDEATSGAGVTIDDVLLKDGEVTTDVIHEATGGAGVTADGVLLKDGEVTTDVIHEKTAATGVTIDSVLLKDGALGTVKVNMIQKSADFNVSAAESGCIYEIGAADKVATLPATAPGLRFKFVLATAGLSAGTGFKVSPNAADALMGNGFTTADDKDAICAGSGDRVGDSIEVVGDAAGAGWFITCVGTWTRE